MPVFWTSVGEFLAMGGYGVYVWGAYGVAAVAILAEVMSVRARARRVGIVSSGVDQATRS
jgi:heme exporter protein D